MGINLEPRMTSHLWETKATKNENSQNLGWCPDDEKPKKQTNKLRQNLGLHPNDGKPNELIMNIDRTQVGILMMRN